MQLKDIFNHNLYQTSGALHYQTSGALHLLTFQKPHSGDSMVVKKFNHSKAA